MANYLEIDLASNHNQGTGWVILEVTGDGRASCVRDYAKTMFEARRKLRVLEQSNAPIGDEPLIAEIKQLKSRLAMRNRQIRDLRRQLRSQS